MIDSDAWRNQANSNFSENSQRFLDSNQPELSPKQMISLGKVTISLSVLYILMYTVQSYEQISQHDIIYGCNAGIQKEPSETDFIYFVLSLSVVVTLSLAMQMYRRAFTSSCFNFLWTFCFSLAFLTLGYTIQANYAWLIGSDYLQFLSLFTGINLLIAAVFFLTVSCCKICSYILAIFLCLGNIIFILLYVFQFLKNQSECPTSFLYRLILSYIIVQIVFVFTYIRQKNQMLRSDEILDTFKDVVVSAIPIIQMLECYEK